MKKNNKNSSKLKLRRIESIPVPDIEILAQVVGGDPPDEQTGCGSCTTPNTIFLTTSGATAP